MLRLNPRSHRIKNRATIVQSIVSSEHALFLNSPPTGKIGLERFSGRHDERCIDHDLGRVLPRSAASWQTIQDEAHGTAARRFGLMFSSQPTQIPNVPASMRRSAVRTSRNQLELRSRLLIAHSRSLACWIRSSSSGLVSIARASRFLFPFPKSVCLFSKPIWNALNSVFVIVTPSSSQLAKPLLVRRAGLLSFNLQLVHYLLHVWN